MAALTTQLGDLANQIQQLSSNPSTEPVEVAALVLPPVPIVIHAGSGRSLANPVRYSGEPGRCKTFLTECDMHFEFSPQDFPTDRSKVGFMILGTWEGEHKCGLQSSGTGTPEYARPFENSSRRCDTPSTQLEPTETPPDNSVDYVREKIPSATTPFASGPWPQRATGIRRLCTTPSSKVWLILFWKDYYP